MVWRFAAIYLCVGLLLISPAAWAGQLVATPCGPGDFLWLTQQGTFSGQVSPDGGISLQRLPLAATAAAEHEAILFLAAAHELWSLSPESELQRVAQLDEPIREMGSVGSHLALLSGGEQVAGELRGAQVRLWREGQPARPAREIRPEWDPYLLRGHDYGQLLVGLRKTARFDPVLRPRPWLMCQVGDDLWAMWKGTSFSLPFVDMALADVGPEYGQPETCALEVTADGRRRVTAYSLTGTTMHAVAMSSARSLGDSLRPCGSHSLACFEATGNSWRLVVLRSGNTELLPGVQELQEAACSLPMGERPVAWVVVTTRQGMFVVAANTAGRLQALPIITEGT